MTRLVVGLGNPGPQYEWTPHNLGFHAVEALARDFKLIFGSSTVLGAHRPPAPCLVARDEGRDVLLVKPLTFMNDSGSVIAPLARSMGIAPEQIMVVFDDIDLPQGALRIRPHGGTGGHNGVRSIVSRLGSDAFPRLRMGVGKPRTDAARHVLQALEGAARVAAEITVAEAAAALAAWAEAGELEKVMTRFHSRWKEMGL
ncbi:MAG: aminoacyl-tRNA hydrolase [Planctomycetes bacterium]|nr:aminoacyl-tRNA hydrolase [Planctomycetota bacterium]